MSFDVHEFVGPEDVPTRRGMCVGLVVLFIVAALVIALGLWVAL